MEGIVEFRRERRAAYRETFARLALGQSPDALFVACSDSRVVPNLFASTEPGDLFVVRNVGNLVAPCGPDGRAAGDESEAAALEFSALVLGVRDIIVCGHSACGAMLAFAEGRTAPGTVNLGSWLRHAQPALERLERGEAPPGPADRIDQLSQLNVLAQLEHLRTYPFLREREAAGSLGLHGWWFDIAEAQVLAFEARQARFVVIDEAEAERILERLRGR